MVTAQPPIVLFGELQYNWPSPNMPKETSGETCWRSLVTELCHPAKDYRDMYISLLESSRRQVASKLCLYSINFVEAHVPSEFLTHISIRASSKSIAHLVDQSVRKVGDFINE